MQYVKNGRDLAGGVQVAGVEWRLFSGLGRVLRADGTLGGISLFRLVRGIPSAFISKMEWTC